MKRMPGNNKDLVETPAPDEPRNAAALASASRAGERCSVAVIGAGRLGTALARALATRGYAIEALVSRRLAHARRAQSLTGAPAGAQPLALAFSDVGRLPPIDVLLVTTPDDAIETVATRLAAVPGADGRWPVALHASGALSSDALAALRARGCSVGSMHPLVSVSDPVVGAEALSDVFFCIEGDRAAVRAARRVVRDLGGRSFTIRARDKALYHAAAVMTSGHSVALFDAATELLARCGLSPARSRRVLLPLLGSTYDNLRSQKNSRALTGTFARGDVAIVRRHLAALASQNLPATLVVYALLGQRSLQLAAEGGAQTDALQKIARLLEQAVGSRQRAESSKQKAEASRRKI